MSAFDEMLKQLEPAASAVGPGAMQWQASAAISLKRIADALEKPSSSEHPEMVVMMSGSGVSYTSHYFAPD
ncbi:hypothetical protein SOP89_26450 [Pseudomonas siliginis]|uniref:hypothetical protein n=1 Tax=Pseudomonas siliginis TaxID=2842346 RepID=UPI002B254839|nr:hypothetical protein [Pseudomonas siliginis]MEB2654909.1 hypothetical protein [Pseudomonas siliginis]